MFKWVVQKIVHAGQSPRKSNRRKERWGKRRREGNFREIPRGGGQTTVADPCDLGSQSVNKEGFVFTMEIFCLDIYMCFFCPALAMQFPCVRGVCLCPEGGAKQCWELFRRHFYGRPPFVDFGPSVCLPLFKIGICGNVRPRNNTATTQVINFIVLWIFV